MSANFHISALLALLALTACGAGEQPVKGRADQAQEPVSATEEKESPDDSAARLEAARLHATALAPTTQRASAASAVVATHAGRAADPARPLPEAVRARFAAIRNDPDPDALVMDAHYWVSNENAHYVWHPIVKGHGGVLSGVGTDQVYLIAAWARSAIVVPLDFDKEIANLHHAYGVAFRNAETPEDFIKLWSKDAESTMEELILAEIPTNGPAIARSYKRGRQTVFGRLRLVVRKYRERGLPTFLTDPDDYAFIRQLWLDGRVFPVCGDLTADRAMLDLAKATAESGLTLGVLYLSNAEHYFEYTPSFRRNIIAQVFGDEGIVLRTRQMSFLGLAEPNDYHYSVQKGTNFQYWMQHSRVVDQYRMLRQRTKTDNPGLSYVDIEPDPNPRPPEIAPLPVD